MYLDRFSLVLGAFKNPVVEGLANWARLIPTLALPAPAKHLLDYNFRQKPHELIGFVYLPLNAGRHYQNPPPNEQGCPLATNTKNTRNAHQRHIHKGGKCFI